MKIDVKKITMKCFMCNKLTRIHDSGLCKECRESREKARLEREASETKQN
jgi:hypothetical protein